MCTALYALTVLNTPWSPNLEPHQCHNTTSFQYRLGLSSICLFSPRQTTVLETPACKGSSSSAGASAMAAGASAMAAGATPCSTWSHSIWSICSLVSWVCTEVSEIQGSKSLEQNNYCATILGSGFRPQKNKSIPGLDTSLLAQILVPLQIQISCCFAKMIQLHQNVIVLTRSDATTSLSALLSLHSQLSFGSRTTGSTDPKIFVCQKLLANRSWFIGRSKNVLCFWNSKRFLTPRCWKKYRWFFPNAESSKMQFHFLATTITYQKKCASKMWLPFFNCTKTLAEIGKCNFEFDRSWLIFWGTHLDQDSMTESAHVTDVPKFRVSFQISNFSSFIAMAANPIRGSGIKMTTELSHSRGRDSHGTHLQTKNTWCIFTILGVSLACMAFMNFIFHTIILWFLWI